MDKQVTPNLDLVVTNIGPTDYVVNVDPQADQAVYEKESTQEFGSIVDGHFDKDNGILTLVKKTGDIVKISGFHTQLTLGQGPSGPKGDKGKNGRDGKTGRDGKEGCVGCQGPLGLKGITGLKGKAGDDGAPGPRGKDGCIGDPGPQGDVGPQGISGVQGIMGKKGSSCIRGPQGPQGPAPVTTVVISTYVPSGDVAHAQIWGAPE